MDNIAAVSQIELVERRQQLRRQRRVRSLQSSWRTLAVSGFAGGLVWVTTQPAWVIRQPEQVSVDGNQFLSTEAVRSLLPISYPESLLHLHPQALAEHLESQGPIAQATVVRQLFPPSLTVQVEEKHPVAITAPNPIDAQAAIASQSNSFSTSAKIGLLDENGTWMPLANYTSLHETFELPTLEVIGMKDQYQPYWAELYQAVSRSPIKVFEIDWREPANLILNTELGFVHFGPYSSKFVEQLNALDQMRQLPDHLNPSQVAYIDLKNPQSPAVQMIQTSSNAKSEVP